MRGKRLSHDWVEYSIKESPYTGATFAVHMVLAHHADKNTGMCWPSQDLIAEEARVTVRTVKRAIKQMCDDGYLERSYRHRQRRYRLLVSNGEGTRVSLEKGHGSPLRRDMGVPSEGTRVSPAYRTVTEPSEEPSNEPKSIRAAREAREDSVPVYGSIDPDAAMPEEGRPVKKTAHHPWAIKQFLRLMREARVGQTGTTIGTLSRAFKKLRDEGYSNEEIVMMSKHFFVRYEHDIRAKRAEIDPSVMFVQRLPQLKEQTETEIENKRAGIKTSVERSTEIQREAMKRLGITEESA
jgi:DNA-binding MarR family transcriptional regulator